MKTNKQRTNIKIYFFVLVLIICSNCILAQRIDGQPLYSPDAIFDNVIDNYGTIYNLAEIEAGKSYGSTKESTVTNVLLCTSGIFELYFETGCGMENTTIAIHNQRRAILCQAFQDISDFINTPLKNSGNINKVKIWIRNPENLIPVMPLDTGGVASAFYNIPLDESIGTNIPTRGIIDNEIWKTIHSGKNSFSNTVFPVISYETNTGFYHGWASFNFAGTVNWNLDYNKYNAATGYDTNSSDFYTVIVHEITHALGFNSLINHYGDSSLFVNTNNIVFGKYYTRYDKNLKTGSNLSLLTNNPATGGQMYDFSLNTSVSQNYLHPNCSLSPPVFNGNSGAFNCSTSLKYVGSTTVPIYNPPCFENGISLSHFEDACYNSNANDQYFMMSDRASSTFAKRFLTHEERQVLCDIGYSVKGTFGNTSNFTYINYNVTACTGITVAGVNDGFTTTGAYAFQGNSGTDITISGILNNDLTGGFVTNLRFEFVQDLYDPNAIFSGTTTSSFIFKSYVPGLHLLRYVPFDTVTGQRGNITYIYVNVFNNCIIDNPCSLVKNGNFEEHNYAPSNGSQIYKSCGWNNASYRTSAEYFNSDGVPSFGIPSNAAGYQTDKITGNHAYAGMFIVPNYYNVLENVYSEPIKTELLSALSPNTQYQLTFDVSMADNYVTNAIKFQAFITDTNLDLTTGGIIPISNITPDKVFLTNSIFSGSTSANTWETVTFTFTTSSNANLKYLYIGCLNNVQFQGSGPSYYYVDNVSLTIVNTPNFLDAVNDNFSNMPILSADGGVTSSVYANDIYNSAPSSSATLPNVSFALVAPFAILGATINNMGLIAVPAGTPPCTYTLTYRLSVIGNCTTSDTATVTIYISNTPITPTLAPGIRADNLVYSVGFQSSGKSIIAGYFRKYNNIPKPYVARLNTDLTLDETFNFTTNQQLMDLDVQTDNKIVTAIWSANFGNGIGISRLLPNGEIDYSFNSNGTGTLQKSGVTNNMTYSCKIQPNGYILLGGDFFYYNNVVRLGIVRLRPDGSIDDSFNPIQLNGYYRSVVTGITLQPDGKILLLGYFTPPVAGATQKNIIRLDSSGNIDTTFFGGDTLNSPFNANVSVSLYSPFSKALVQPDGKIIIAGAFTKYSGFDVKNIIRVNSNGSIDYTFNFSTGVERAINDMLLEPSSNRIIIGGEFLTFGGVQVKKMIRLTINGSLDNSFSIGTGTTDSVIYPDCYYCSNNVKVLKQQLDGKIIVGGKFTTFNGLSATNITRIFGSAGDQARGSIVEYQSEPEIDTNPNPNFSSITIYPNPSKGIYTADFSLEKEESQITIINILGETVYSTTLNAEQQNLIDITHLSNGYYIARISNASKTSQHKLIKN